MEKIEHEEENGRMKKLNDVVKKGTIFSLFRRISFIKKVKVPEEQCTFPKPFPI